MRETMGTVRTRALFLPVASVVLMVSTAASTSPAPVRDCLLLV
jgi:hypothetical protein